MRYSNLHTHSTFSDGKHTIEENILSAIDRDMLSIGFSDHSFTEFDQSYCIKKDGLGDYLRELNRMQKLYGDRIPIYQGIEQDYFSEVPEYDFDFTIASVHYIIKDGNVYPLDLSPAEQQRCIRDAFGGSVLHMAACYYSMVKEHVASLKPTFVGHFDLINKFGLMPTETDEYREISVNTLKEVIALCPYIELNTGAMSRGWREEPYPQGFLLKAVLDLGGEILLSSDSHNKNHLTYYFDESVELLRKTGFDHINVFNGRGFVREKIV